MTFVKYIVFPVKASIHQAVYWSSPVVAQDPLLKLLVGSSVTAKCAPKGPNIQGWVVLCEGVPSCDRYSISNKTTFKLTSYDFYFLHIHCHTVLKQSKDRGVWYYIRCSVNRVKTVVWCLWNPRSFVMCTILPYSNNKLWNKCLLAELQVNFLYSSNIQIYCSFRGNLHWSSFSYYLLSRIYYLNRRNKLFLL